jgi:hypothetical protein
VVPVEKKGTEKNRVCVDFKDLNRVNSKDEYPMLVADVLINSTSGNKVIHFTAKEDVSKTAFWCPGFVGLFEWAVMTFGLKNAGDTYQWAMNLVFHDLLGIILEIYIDDVAIKLIDFEDHLGDLRVVLERMRQYGLKMNPLKCAFGVSVGRILGFVVHEHGIQVDPKKIESIRNLGEATWKKEVQNY